MNTAGVVFTPAERPRIRGIRTRQFFRATDDFSAGRGSMEQKEDNLMSHKLFVSLPIKDLDRTMAFFKALGFTFKFMDEKAACMLIGEHAYAMLLVESFFKTFTKKEICDTATHVEGPSGSRARAAPRWTRWWRRRSPAAARRRGRRRTTGSCTAGASRTSTGTTGRWCGWLRADLYDDVRLQGRVWLGCPRCGSESEVDLITLALLLGPNPWPVAGPDGWPAAPSLSTPRPLGERPPACHARAARASCCRRCSSPCRGRSPRRCSARRSRPCATPRVAICGAARTSRSIRSGRTGPGAIQAFAQLCASRSRRALDDTRDVEPALIERMPVTDVLFADAVYHYLYIAPIADPARAMIACTACKQPFLAAL